MTVLPPPISPGFGTGSGLARSGLSLDRREERAVAELHACIQAPDLRLAVVFASSELDRMRLARALRDRFGAAPVIGCTAAMPVGGHGYTPGIAGFSLSGDEVVAVSRRLDGAGALSMKDGYDAAQALLWDLDRVAPGADETNTFGFLMIDGLCLAEERVASAIGMALGAIPLFGGSAADDLRFLDTAVLHDGRFHRDCAVLTLVHLRRPFRVFSAQHYETTGIDVVVTEADSARRVVHALNGRPAAEEYARLVGVPRAALGLDIAAAHPLIFRAGGRNYARGIGSFNDDGSMTFGCAIDTGLVLGIARTGDLRANLSGLFGRLRQDLGPLELTFACDCAVRMLEIQHKGLETRVADLYAANQVVGFASFGEQVGPMHVNQTFTGVAIAGPGVSGGPIRAPGSANNLIIHEPAPPATPLGGAGDAALGTEGPTGADGDEVARLRRVVQALVDRSQRNANLHADNFSLFQNAIILEETVKKRTAELMTVNHQLSRELAERRDIEEALRAAKRQAEQANQMKSQFLAAIGHDLQQPLNAARLFLGTLGEGDISGGQRFLIDRTGEALESVDDLLSSLLDITSLDSGMVPVNVADVPLMPLMRQLAAEYRPQAEIRGLALRAVPCGLSVRTDPGLLVRILRNLLSNALRYTPAGRVLFGCRRQGDTVWVEVWDSGVGMPAEKLQEIFREFHRLDHPRVTVARGLGLGLAIVDRIAVMLGLDVKVRSTEGCGSMFAVRVPLAAGSAPPPGRRGERGSGAAAADLAPVLRGRRVLVLDDDPAILDGMTALLDAWGCVPVAAASFREAIRAVAGGAPPPDLIIADHNIAEDDLTGVDTVDAIRARLGRAVPAIIITSSREPAVAEAVAERRLGLMHKPVRPGRLRTMLAHLLAPA